MSIKEKKEKGHKRLIILAVIVVAVGIAAFFGIQIAKNVKGVSIANDVSITVSNGDGSSSVSEKLSQSGAVKYPFVFRIMSRFMGYDSKYQPGKVTVKNGMSYTKILDTITHVGSDVVTITIPEGYELRQIKQLLLEKNLTDEDKFKAAMNLSDYNYKYKFLQNIPDRENALEGFLFPGTYKVTPGMSTHDIIDNMLAAFNSHFKAEYYTQAANVDKLSIDQIVTLASIIEREAGAADNRAKISGVFYNRLNSHMKLQSCATVQYVLGERKTVLSNDDTKIDSKYNTYLYEGLPVGPISNPGEASIKAALYPEKTDAFYFLAGKDGKTVFSKTFEEHQAAMKAAGVSQ